MGRVELAIQALDGTARTGVATVRGRRFRTPAFMPVGTAATVKGLAPSDLQRADVEIMLANTYHLRLRPGPAVVRGLGGLHRFTGFPGAILTDSGGYQIFSHTDRVKVTEAGATFRSHLDGESIELSPEEVVRIQDALDPDIAMVLDQPVALPATPELAREAGDRTLRWAERSIDYHRRTVSSGQALFGIVQGAVDVELRAEQARRLREFPFDGFAIGGLAVGESRAEMAIALAASLPLLPEDLPRYVMGIGYPEDLLVAIGYGADMFDCVLPTRHARTAQAFTSRGVVKLRHAAHRTAAEPLDPDCACETCATFSLGYLSHLFHADEMLGPILIARHNVYFYQQLVHAAGAAIAAGRFAAFRDTFLARYRSGEQPLTDR